MISCEFKLFDWVCQLLATGQQGSRYYIFINDKWRKYAGDDIGCLFKITRRLELRFWLTRKRSQPSQGDFFARIAEGFKITGCLQQMTSTTRWLCKLQTSTIHKWNIAKKACNTHIPKPYSLRVPNKPEFRLYNQSYLPLCSGWNLGRAQQQYYWIRIIFNTVYYLILSFFNIIDYCLLHY
jgi:hypothetical protein